MKIKYKTTKRMKNNIISVGIFFDGTGNNGVNATSSQKPSQNNESYYNNITNIYKLSELFIGDTKVYIEGIGTLTGSEDSDYAMATCKNPMGYSGYSSDDKMRKAYDFISKTVVDSTKDYDFYVYGFSRGSMLARALCNKLLSSDSKIQGNIRIKFLGVFDTVESAPFNDYNVTVLPRTERALHICAVNECRYFFPLTGFFEDSKDMEDTKSDTGTSVWKEIFVPGAHADVGGGYLEGSQSVYVSPNFVKNNDLVSYVENVRTAATDSKRNKIWNSLLQNYKVDQGEVFSQAYVERDLVYNELSKVYGKLMLIESNAEEPIFRTDFSETDFDIDANSHPYLIELSNALENYTNNISSGLKPDYDYGKLADYTHISANFGLYHHGLVLNSRTGANEEFINNGLNVPSNSDDQFNANQPKLQSEIHHVEDSIVDYAYGTNIPNNDNWSRTILIKENFYNKC